MKTDKIQTYQGYMWHSLRWPIKEGKIKKLIEREKNNFEYSINLRIERNVIQKGQDK